MQISGYSSAAMLAYRSSGMKQKAGTVKMQDFSQMVQNTSAQATSNSIWNSDFRNQVGRRNP